MGSWLMAHGLMADREDEDVKTHTRHETEVEEEEKEEKRHCINNCNTQKQYIDTLFIVHLEKIIFLLRN